jgi:hypothetical protein
VPSYHLFRRNRHVKSYDHLFDPKMERIWNNGKSYLDIIGLQLRQIYILRVIGVFREKSDELETDQYR